MNLQLSRCSMLSFSKCVIHSLLSIGSGMAEWAFVLFETVSLFGLCMHLHRYWFLLYQ